METGIVSSGNFIQHATTRDRSYGRGILLVHKPVIIIADDMNKELKTYDLTSWQCVSQCTTPSHPLCLYESDGDVSLYCSDGSLYNISSVQPLTISTSPHGHVTGVKCSSSSFYRFRLALRLARRRTACSYWCISHLGPGRLVAVSSFPSSVHVITPDGRQLADLTTCGGYRFTKPIGVVCGGGRVVVTGECEDPCLGREWEDEYRVVCIGESAGTWSVQWMHHVASGYPYTPVITPGGGTVIVPCNGSPGCIVSLSMDTGAVIQQVDVAPGCPELGMGTCVYDGSLLVGCWGTYVVEFSLQLVQGKMVCHHACVVVVVGVFIVVVDVVLWWK
jgi:hypothetical protein